MDSYKAGGINRDPQEILAYAKEIDTYYEDQKALIAAAKSTVEGCLSSLDQKSQEFGNVFLEKTKWILSELEQYKELADDLKKSAQNLIELQNAMHFG